VIDLSSLRAPGWQRVVAELASPAADDRAFMVRLLSALCQVSGARQGVLFLVPNAPRGESPDEAPADADPRAILVWPATPDLAAALERGESGEASLPDSAIERAADARSAVRKAAITRQSQIFGLDTDDMLYDSSGGKGYLIAVPIPGGSGGETAAAPVNACVTLLLDQRSRQALQTTLALLEVLVGYVHTHQATQHLRRTRSASAALDLAARLIASVNHTPNFKGACIQLCNDLSRQIGVDRVAMGWVGEGKGRESRMFSKVVALSDTEQIDRRMAMIQKIEAAMDECLDQEQPVMFPVPPAQGPNADVLLSQAIVHAHRELAASGANVKVASLPLRIDEKVIGVVLVESSAAGPIELATVELLQAALDLVAPVLQIRRSDDRWLVLRAWDSTLRAGAWLVGPRHTAWKLAGIAFMVATLVVTFVNVPYRVGSTMELQPREPRTVSVPFSGKIARLGASVEAGRRVEAGQVLVEMDTTELRLKAMESQSSIVQAEKEADAALKKNNLSDAQQAQAKAEQARARLELANHNITSATLRAPISGTITAGDLKDKVGATVEIGQGLFQVADLTDMVVVAKVDDRDISFMKEGMTGQISTKADPSREFDFVVEKIVPLSKAQEGKNSFEVRCTLTSSAPWFRPGMEGVARFNTPERSLAWIGGRRIVDQMRLWLWW